MNKQSHKAAYIFLHLAVLLFGLTAILGVLIDMRALDIVWWRVLITSLSLLFFLKWGRSLRKISKKSIWTFLGIGAIVALHWLCFYGAVKLSNASITLVCMATASFFTSLIEPAITKTPWKKSDILIGLIIVPGMALIVGDLKSEQLLGVGVGLLSAALAALFASLNKKHISKADHYSITFLEMTGAWVFLSLVLPFIAYKSDTWIEWPTSSDWMYLLILALLCTTLAYILALKALKHLSAFASNLVINLEPVYGIILAIFLLKEHKDLSPSFYFGVVIIVGVVFIYPYLNKRK